MCEFLWEYHAAAYLFLFGAGAVLGLALAVLFYELGRK